MRAQHNYEAFFYFFISIVHRNIVATCNLAVELDLKTIALHARNAEYNPKVRTDASPQAPRLKQTSFATQRFAAVIMRIREPKTTALGGVATGSMKAHEAATVVATSSI